MTIDNEKGSFIEMNRDTLKLAIATEKLIQAANFGIDAVGHLTRYRLTKDTAADFEQRDAESACVKALGRIWDARMHFLAAGGQKSAPEYREAAVAFKQAAKVGGEMFDITGVLDTMRKTDGARIVDFAGFKGPTPWGETATRYLQLAA
jgi:hypothetical protein